MSCISVEFNWLGQAGRLLGRLLPFLIAKNKHYHRLSYPIDCICVGWTVKGVSTGQTAEKPQLCPPWHTFCHILTVGFKPGGFIWPVLFKMPFVHWKPRWHWYMLSSHSSVCWFIYLVGWLVIFLHLKLSAFFVVVVAVLRCVLQFLPNSVIRSSWSFAMCFLWCPYSQRKWHTYM